MSFSFSLKKGFSAKSQSQSNRLKKASAATPQSINYVSEFCSDEAPPSAAEAAESKIKPIAPIPNAWLPNKKFKNLPNLAQIAQSDAAAVQFELNPQSTNTNSNSCSGYGLNLWVRQPSDAPPIVNYEETISDMELRILREDWGKRPDYPSLDEYEDVPVEGFGAALLSGYGWEEGRGIGRNANAKDDVKVAEVTRKRDRGGLGFTDEQHNTNSERKRLKVGSRDVVMEAKCMRKKSKELNDRNLERKRVNWLSNHIRVRIVSQEFKGGRLYLKKGVVVDVVGPGVCDISVDESRELVQGVDQDLLETALLKCGGPVLILGGRHKGVNGTLLERDPDKETALIRDADTHHR